MRARGGRRRGKIKGWAIRSDKRMTRKDEEWMIFEGWAMQKVGRVSSRDAKDFFEDPEARSPLDDFHLRNPGVFILMIFAFFMGFLSTLGNPGVYFHYGILWKQGINALILHSILSIFPNKYKGDENLFICCLCFTWSYAVSVSMCSIEWHELIKHIHINCV